VVGAVKFIGCPGWAWMLGFLRIYGVRLRRHSFSSERQMLWNVWV